MKHTLFFLSLLLTSMSYAQTVTIGSQVWVTKNLDVATFRNGDPIPEAKTNEEWVNAGDNRQPAWCYYNNDPSNGTKYGKLYNWYAVIDPRGLAPEGFHVPSINEWSYLEGVSITNLKFIKSGQRRDTGDFFGIGESGCWWSSTPRGADGLVKTYYEENHLSTSGHSKYRGLSVRCIKD